MKRILTTASVLLLASAGAAYAAAPGTVATTLRSCCEMIMNCC